MSLSLSHLCDHICSKSVGIIWLTDEDIGYESYGLVEFNYLLDGILMNALKDQTYEGSHQANYFLGSNFGNPFFIGHVRVEKNQDLQLIDSHINISDHFIQESSKIFVFNKSKNTANHNIIKILQEKFPTLQFQNLNI